MGQDNAQWHKDATKQAKTYIDSSWMHTPWLTARFLTDLLDVELAPLNREAKSVGEFDLMLMPIIWRVPPLSYYWRFKVARERDRLAHLAHLLTMVVMRWIRAITMRRKLPRAFDAMKARGCKVRSQPGVRAFAAQ